jgi:uncharacterized protein (DUF1015 family)
VKHPDLAVPFRGERFAAAGRLSRLIAPPYDVISTAERARYAAQDAHNIVHIMLPEAASQAGDPYARAAELLARWRSDGTLACDSEPAVYVLAQDFALPSGERRTRVGAFVALAAEGYEPRRVRPHERTHAGPKADRLALLRATRTSIESILVIAPDTDGRLTAALRAVTATPPAAAAELAGVGMRLWMAAAGAEATRLAELVRAPLYIADGHHRYETASTFAREQPGGARLLALVVSARDEGLAVLATHRVIRGAPMAPEELARGWRLHFEVTDLPPGSDAAAHLAGLGLDRTGCVVVWPGGRAMALARRAGLAQPGEVAVATIDALVVQPITRRAGTAELIYTPDAQEAAAAARQGGAAAAVLLNPTRIEEVFTVADAGGIMPPKSTYFVPKVPAGLVLMASDGRTGGPERARRSD